MMSVDGLTDTKTTTTGLDVLENETTSDVL